MNNFNWGIFILKTRQKTNSCRGIKIVHSFKNMLAQRLLPCADYP